MERLQENVPEILAPKKLNPASPNTNIKDISNVRFLQRRIKDASMMNTPHTNAFCIFFTIHAYHTLVTHTVNRIKS